MRQAAVALIEEDGLFLSVSRKTDATLLGLPGGSVEPNESIDQAMVRELFEETGLKAIEYSFFYKDYDGYDFETNCFLVTKFEGEATSKELGVVKWVESELLESGPFAWYNKKVFEKYFSNDYMHCQSHCCLNCNTCKYGYKNCPVITRRLIQDNPCETCENHDDRILLSEEILDIIKEHIKEKPNYNMQDIISHAVRNLPLEKEQFCNCCGLTCKLNDQDASGNYGLINAKVAGHYASTPGNGSGALDDCSTYSFSLCEFCCDWLFQQFKLPVFVDNMGEVEEFKSASDRVTSGGNFRSMKEKFFTEKYKRDIARGK